MSVVVLEPVQIQAPLADGFLDIDVLVAEAEQDTGTRQAIAAGRQAVAENFYAGEAKSLSWYRLKRGWSQRELATRMSTSQSYIARLEAGEIDPQVSTLQRLAAVFEVSAASLLDALAQGPRLS